MIIKYVVSAALILSFSASSTILVFGMVLPSSVEPIAEVASPDANEVNTDTDDASDTVARAGSSEKKTKSSTDKSEDSSSPDDPSTSPSEPSSSPTDPGTSPPPPPSSPSPSPSPSPAPPSNPTPPPPSAPACGAGGPCTTSQVAAHNSQSDCWVIYNSKVYNVTGFVSRHGGGRAVFNSNTCGKDIGIYLSGTREPVSGERFNHSSGDVSDINPYYIAELS